MKYCGSISGSFHSTALYIILSMSYTTTKFTSLKNVPMSNVNKGKNNFYQW